MIRHPHSPQPIIIIVFPRTHRISRARRRRRRRRTLAVFDRRPVVVVVVEDAHRTRVDVTIIILSSLAYTPSSDVGGRRPTKRK